MIQKNTLPEKLEINLNNIELLKNQLKSTDRQLILTKLGFYFLPNNKRTPTNTDYLLIDLKQAYLEQPFVDLD